MPWLSGFLKTRLGRYLLRMALKYGLSFLRQLWKRFMRWLEQMKIDKENEKRYDKVTEGKLPDEEDFDRLEDLLNGRDHRVREQSASTEKNS